MREKIEFIKEKFAAAKIEQLPAVIEEYRADSRSGVQKEIEKAFRKMEALEKEKVETLYPSIISNIYNIAPFSK